MEKTFQLRCFLSQHTNIPHLNLIITPALILRRWPTDQKLRTATTIDVCIMPEQMSLPLAQQGPNVLVSEVILEQNQVQGMDQHSILRPFLTITLPLPERLVQQHDGAQCSARHFVL